MASSVAAATEESSHAVAETDRILPKADLVEYRTTLSAAVAHNNAALTPFGHRIRPCYSSTFLLTRAHSMAGNSMPHDAAVRMTAPSAVSNSSSPPQHPQDQTPHQPTPFGSPPTILRVDLVQCNFCGSMVRVDRIHKHTSSLHGARKVNARVHRLGMLLQSLTDQVSLGGDTHAIAFSAHRASMAHRSVRSGLRGSGGRR